MNTTQEFRVEGHGAELAMVGGVGLSYAPWRKEPLLTRDGAWQVVKELASEGRYHTIKVYKGGSVVFRAFRQVDGSYIDAATCKKVA